MEGRRPPYSVRRSKWRALCLGVLKCPDSEAVYTVYCLCVLTFETRCTIIGYGTAGVGGGTLENLWHRRIFRVALATRGAKWCLHPGGSHLHTLLLYFVFIYPLIYIYVCVYVGKCWFMYVHTYLFTYIPTRSRTYVLTNIPTRSRTYKLSRTYLLVHVHTYSFTYCT